MSPAQPPSVHLDGVPFDLIFQRVTDRLVSAQKPERTTLPESKDEFPKLLCLDMNKWIGLAQAHYGHPSGRSFEPALAAITTAVGVGRLVVPVLGANALEVMQNLRIDQKRRLAKFMTDVSGNHSMRHEAAVTILELAFATVTEFAGMLWAESLRGQLVHRGISSAITGGQIAIGAGTADLDVALTEVFNEPEASVEALVGCLDAETVATSRRDDADLACLVDRVRRNELHVALPVRRKMEFRAMLNGQQFRQLLRQALLGVGVSEPVLSVWLETDSNMVRFAGAVAGFDVEACLMLQRDRNLNHAPAANDSRDFSFLRVAIPYANVVVTEKSWSHLANATGLQARYGTTVMHNEAKIPAVLEAMGCI